MITFRRSFSAVLRAATATAAMGLLGLQRFKRGGSVS